MTNTAIVHPQSQKQPKLVKKITRKGYLTEVDNCIKHVSSSLEIFEKANEMGKQLGYTNLQIGRDFKQRAKALGKSDRTIQRFLPSEYKSKPRGATTPEKISAKMALNEAAIKMVEVEANVELPEAGQLLQYEITGCYNNSVGDSSGAYYCKEHLEPMREKHALARKTAAEVVGKFLQLSGESQPQLKPELQPGQTCNSAF